MPEPGGGELGGGPQQALNDHGQQQVALARGLGVDQSGELQAADGFEDHLDMAMRKGAFDDEEFIRMDERDVLEDETESFDLVRGHLERLAMVRLRTRLPFAPAFAQEDGGAGVTVGDGVDVHGN